MFDSKIRILVLGVGNRMKGDDAFGSLLAEELKIYESENLSVIDSGSVPENYIKQIIDFSPQYIVILDTVYSLEKKCGEIVILKNIDDIPSISTHAGSMSLFLQALKMQGLNARVFLIGVVPKDVSLKEGISNEVQSGIKKLKSEFPQYLKDLTIDK